MNNVLSGIGIGVRDGNIQTLYSTILYKIDCLGKWPWYLF